MSTIENTIVETVRTMTLKDLTVLVLELQSKIVKLEEQLQPKPKAEGIEMTDDHARRILNGDLKDKSHKDAAQILGLTYGQVYSCRGQYTFKHIWKELKAEGFNRTWTKA